MSYTLAWLSLLLAPVSQAAPAMPTFEQTLHQIHGQILTARRDQLKSTLNRDLTRAGWDAASLSTQVRRLRSSLSDVVRRARQQSGSQPPADPSLRWAVQRLSWDLRSHERSVAALEAESKRLASIAQNDPEAHASASAFLSWSRFLRSDSRWLDNDARFGVWDLRRAGFWLEAMDIDRAASNSYAGASRIEILASDILAKVRQ